MGGVDLSDQRVGTYRRHMKSLTFVDIQIFYHFLRLSVVQAFVIYKELNPESKKDQRSFTVDVIDGLIAGRCFKKKRKDVKSFTTRRCQIPKRTESCSRKVGNCIYVPSSHQEGYHILLL